MAIVSCGTGLWRLSFVGDEDCVDHRLEKILITAQDNVCCRPLLECSHLTLLL